MNPEHSLMASQSISDQARSCYSFIQDCMTEAGVMYRLDLTVDGNQWCALYGADLQSGIAGFGDSPAAAMNDFNRNWDTPLRNSPRGLARTATTA